MNKHITSLTEFIDSISEQVEYYGDLSIRDIDFDDEYVDLQDSSKDVKNRSEFMSNMLLYNHEFVERRKKIFIRSHTGPRFFYRGMKDVGFKNASGIYRAKERHTEDYYFYEINVRCPTSFKTMSNLEKLVFMQHYGCPTRLLDISSNPLVALYFACAEGSNTDGVVYVFGIQADELLYAQSDRVQMLSKLAEFKEKEQFKIRELAYKYLSSNNFPHVSNSKYKDSVIERFYHAIKRDNGAFEREIVPLDLLQPLFVQPNKDNPRMLKQDGAFIISGLDFNEHDSNRKIHKYVVSQYIIDRKHKNNILRQLGNIGINQATLFPEVDKVADYLKK